MRVGALFAALCAVEAGATVASDLHIETAYPPPVEALRSSLLRVPRVDASNGPRMSPLEESPQVEFGVGHPGGSNVPRRLGEKEEVGDGQSPLQNAQQLLRSPDTQDIGSAHARLGRLLDGQQRQQSERAFAAEPVATPDSDTDTEVDDKVEETVGGAPDEAERPRAERPVRNRGGDAPHHAQVPDRNAELSRFGEGFSNEHEGVSDRRLAELGAGAALEGGPQMDLGGNSGRGARLLRAPGWTNIIALAAGFLVSAFGYSAYTYGGPRVALRIHKLHLKRKMPLSWNRYLSNLPVLDESRFEEFDSIMQWLKPGVRLVKRVAHVSSALADFLGLDEETRRTGIVIKVKSSMGAEARRLMYEINAHTNMVPRNPFFLPLIGAFRGTSNRAVYLLLPRARADVADYVKARPFDVDVRLAAAEMVYAEYILHESGFLHRDIKAHNFFVGFDGHVLLADFEGVGVLQQRTPVVGTRGYFAPELSRPTDHTEKSDVFALGQTFKRIAKYLGQAVRIPRLNEFWSLVKKMTAKDPRDRPTMKAIMSDPYFDGIDFARLELKDQGVPFKGDFSIDVPDAAGPMFVQANVREREEDRRED
ncbi:unnamed protein product [Neospora caninum Liverpool]|uniref:Rhoptry kinase family protein ROP35, putative n=1 Tax=Neospora caninum (strain Liverpool) TaxID=572307 RepID=F0VB03_NEOCL|nr:uncharacterized protein NCLIV_044410 [Neospora caninum Liverpool]CBZ51379.1 unnamed protein product [Neospora caninum Liverpool]CEL68699.1 TPA: Rhoptry kinase family protein ROP35, putative [Neospora caninum Liverpool]|eukprot:XP_003881412.1 uncharacterized protein NCLIV_044410 [Neospora caninum Liverpool]